MFSDFIKKVIRKIKSKVSLIGKKPIIIICVIAFILASVVVTWNYMTVSRTNHITLTLNYADARKGLTPSGGRFNAAEIKSDEVLQRTIDILGDDSLSVEELKDAVTVNTKVPQSSVDKVTTAIASDTSYTYCPSEFDVYYVQKHKLSRNKTDTFLEALAQAYEEYFTTYYAEKNTILDYDIEDELSNYDYSEQCQMLTDKVDSMLSYLKKYNSENSAYRSPETGYSFSNLISMLNNIRDVDLAKLDSYITQNGISKDKQEYIRKQNYSIEKKSLQHNVKQQSSDIANNAMAIYNSHITGVAFIPSLDDSRQYYMSRTKTGLDLLVVDSYDSGIIAGDIWKEIDRHLYLSDKYSAAPEATSDAKQYADDMIKEIGDYIKKISDMAIQTDKDYVQDKAKNYITIIHQPKPRMAYVAMFFTMVVLFLVLIILAIMLYRWFVVKFSGKIRVLLEHTSKKFKLDEE